MDGRNPEIVFRNSANNERAYPITSIVTSYNCRPEWVLNDKKIREKGWLPSSTSLSNLKEFTTTVRIRAGRKATRGHQAWV